MKKHKIEHGIPYIVLAGIFGLLIYLNIFHLSHWLDSDMAAEMIFSRLLAEENKWFATTNWYYSSEFRILYTQLVMGPLFRWTQNWHVVRAMTNLVFYVLLFGSYGYMMRPLKLQKKWVIWTGIILLLPFSETLMTHMQMGNTYMSHLILIFIIFGIFLRLADATVQKEKLPKGKLQRGVLFCLYILLNLICGMSGVRYLLALQSPLVITATVAIIQSKEFATLRKDMSRDNWTKLFHRKEMPYLYYAVTGAVLAVVGYGVNILFIEKSFSFQTYGSIHFIAVYKGIFLERLQNTFGSLLMLFGYISDKSVLSLRGLITVVAFVLLGLLLFVAVRSKKLLLDNQATEEGTTSRNFLYTFFLVAFILNTFVFIFTNSTVVDRYYITVMVFALPCIGIYFEKENIPLDRWLVGLLLAGCLFLGTAKTVYSFLTVDKNADKQTVADFLEEQGHDFGYATYWNANIITELSNGAVEMGNLMADPQTTEVHPEFVPFQWSSPLKYYTEDYKDKATFVLFTKEELEEFQAYRIVQEGEVLYEDDHYTVLSYE